MSQLNGVPGGGQLWKVGNHSYLVYFVPGQSRQIPMFWRVHDRKQLEALMGPGKPIRYQREINSISSVGGIMMGAREELVNNAEHPFRVLMANFEREATTRPWLRDPEVLAHVAAALLEGRTVSEADLKTTNWWRSRNEQQRNWLVLRESDPMQAERFKQDTTLRVQALLDQAGLRNVPASVVGWMGAWVTNGRWSEAMLNQQIQALGDPSRRHLMPDYFREIFETGLQNQRDRNYDGFEISSEGEQRVRDTVRQWLGPSHGWSDEQVSNWAARIRSNSGEMDRLTQALAKQRKALFPEYEDESLTYEDIAAPWRGFVNNIWGQVPDEHDPMFERVVRANDSVEARRLLINEGIKRQNSKVAYDMLGAVSQATGSGISAHAL